MRGGALKIRDLKHPYASARRVLQSLKSDHPKLDAHLVVSSYATQFEIDSSPWNILKTAPAIFVATKLRDELILLYDAHEKLRVRNEAIKSEFIASQVKSIAARVDSILSEIDINEDANLELRFGDLDFDLIALLQKDLRIDRARTPQSRSSIRVVIGSLRALATKSTNSERREAARTHNSFGTGNDHSFQ